MSDQSEILKRILVAVLPGIAVTLAVCLLMLGVGVVILTEGAPLVRSLTGTLPQPWRSMVLLATLAAGLAAVGIAGKLILGYIMTR
jgi:hypothetical protein